MKDLEHAVASEDSSIRAWREGLTTEIQRLESRFQRAMKRWNFWYYACLYGPVVLSALAALILKLESVTGAWQKDVAAGLAALSAIVGTAMVTVTSNVDGVQPAAPVHRYSNSGWPC